MASATGDPVVAGSATTPYRVRLSAAVTVGVRRPSVTVAGRPQTVVFSGRTVAGASVGRPVAPEAAAVVGLPVVEVPTARTVVVTAGATAATVVDVGGVGRSGVTVDGTAAAEAAAAASAAAAAADVLVAEIVVTSASVVMAGAAVVITVAPPVASAAVPPNAESMPFVSKPLRPIDLIGSKAIDISCGRVRMPSRPFPITLDIDWNVSSLYWAIVAIST